MLHKLPVGRLASDRSFGTCRRTARANYPFIVSPDLRTLKAVSPSFWAESGFTRQELPAAAGF